MEILKGRAAKISNYTDLSHHYDTIMPSSCYQHGIMSNSVLDNLSAQKVLEIEYVTDVVIEGLTNKQKIALITDINLIMQKMLAVVLKRLQGFSSSNLSLQNVINLFLVEQYDDIAFFYNGT